MQIDRIVSKLYYIRRSPIPFREVRSYLGTWHGVRTVSKAVCGALYKNSAHKLGQESGMVLASLASSVGGLGVLSATWKVA